MIASLWDSIIVKTIARVIIGMAYVFHGYVGLSIIVFTLLIRLCLAPLSYGQEERSHYRQKFISPRYAKISKKYNTRDSLTLQKMFEKRYQLERIINKHNHGKHHYTFLFVLIELIFFFGLYQAVSEATPLYHATFLWVKLGHSDPYFVLPIIAGVLTFASSILIGYINQSLTHLDVIMSVVIALVIIVTGIHMASIIVVYWIALYLANLLQEALTGYIWHYQNKKKQVA